MSERFLTRDCANRHPCRQCQSQRFCGVPIGGYTAGARIQPECNQYLSHGVYSPTNGVPDPPVRTGKSISQPTRALATWSSLATSSRAQEKRNGEKFDIRIDQSISNKTFLRPLQLWHDSTFLPSLQQRARRRQFQDGYATT